MAELPFVTVGMPCLNEREYIEPCLRAVLEQDYPAHRFEVIVADGGSTDGTLDILERMAQTEPRLRVVNNPGRYQSAGMNEVIRRSEGDVVVRLDVHGHYAPNYIRTCIDVLEKTGADNAGGAARSLGKGWFQRALCAALGSPLGVGGSSYRSADKEGFVDTVFNGAFRREVFEKAGMYDPRAITNEDAELNQRILASGGKIYLSRDIEAYYYPRDTLTGLARQYFRYGMGRARTLLKHRTLPTPRPLVPFAMTVTAAGLLLTWPLQPLTGLAAGLYLTATGYEALRVGRREGLWAVPVVWSIFPVLHFAHGTGFGWGLVHYLRHPDWSEAERLAPRQTLRQAASA